MNLMSPFNSRRHSLALVGILCYLCALFAPAFAQEAVEAPLDFLPVWIDESADLSQDSVDELVEKFASQNPNPEHIVFWIHGFETDRESSLHQYKVLTRRLKDAFKKEGVDEASVGVVGIQWDSKSHGFIFKLPGQYFEKARLARKVGRQGFRRITLALQERFPEAHLTFFGHSMGCEVAMAANRPEVHFSEKENEKEPPVVFRPEAEIRLFACAILGADLDYDIGYKSHLAVRKHKSLKLLWMTASDFFRRKGQDKILGFRSIIRGKAWGSKIPRLTEKQYDALLGGRVAVFDTRAVPRHHKFLLYYDKVRLGRLVAGMLYKLEPKSRVAPPEIRVINEVMDSPNTVEALVPLLDSEQTSAIVYALWRLEHLFGSGSENLSNTYLSKIASVTLHMPRAIDNMRASSPSQTVRDGYWPTKRLLTRAGAPDWANPRGLKWKKDFLGEVTYLDDQIMRVATGEFRDPHAFDITPNTKFTPSLTTLRVGSIVEIQSIRKRLLNVQVLPLSEWVRDPRNWEYRK